MPGSRKMMSSSLELKLKGEAREPAIAGAVTEEDEAKGCCGRPTDPVMEEAWLQNCL
jgi:hypothetical protein